MGHVASYRWKGGTIQTVTSVPQKQNIKGWQHQEQNGLQDCYIALDFWCFRKPILHNQVPWVAMQRACVSCCTVVSAAWTALWTKNMNFEGWSCTSFTIHVDVLRRQQWREQISSKRFWHCSRCLGHVGRMEERIPKQLSFRELMKTQSWYKEEVEGLLALQLIGVGEEWYDICQDK